VVKSKAAWAAAAKLLVKNTPHTINAADSAAVIQNTDPVWENILCIGEPSFPNTTRADWNNGGCILATSQHRFKYRMLEDETSYAEE
jgi:hypothetical protein